MSRAPIIFDFNRTLFDPSVYSLYQGVVPMLDELRIDRQMLLYSRKGWNRAALLKRLGIDGYFDGAHFVEKKTPGHLREILDNHALDASRCIMVGDMLEDEICVGAALGMRTVWFQHTLSAPPESGLACVPHFTVGSIAELRELLRALD